ncbi:MAG: tetratricopeptide repeat protein [Sedimentisphaerales bacterium]|nr:tetratricopeptide repeat protein [Sedimentisphaerales bacterium]
MVYFPVYRYEFVSYDDNGYVYENSNIKTGITLKTIKWAFTTGYFSYWHPLTWLSHTLDWQLFKVWAGGHHLVNVLLHILNTLLLFYIFVQMTDAIWPSAFIATAFALHPLHVESVAWIAERKDVLSTFFWILTMLAYHRYTKNLKLKWYLLTLVLFVMGLMSKPMLVTVPFVLLLLDYWPLERKISWRLLTEKIPFLICSLASSVITFFVQQSIGAMAAIKTFGFKIRLSNAIISYITYITKMIWPGRLAVFYPHPGSALSVTKVAICGLLLVLISIYFLHKARQYKFLIVGWLWYLGTLVPVIGLVQVGSQAMADRYTYMTLTGLFIIIAFGAKDLMPKWRYKNIILTLSAIIILAASTLTSQRQLKYWKNSITLFEHTLQVTKNNYIIMHNYAKVLTKLGRLDEAIEIFNRSLSIKPDWAEIHDGLGCALTRCGRVSEAIKHFELAIKYKPDFAPIYNNFASALYKQGRKYAAIDYFNKALELKPDYVKPHFALGITYNSLKKFDKAIEHFDKVLELDPANIIVYSHLYTALAAINRTDEAIQAARITIKAMPNNAAMHHKLGTLLEKQGKFTEAIESYRTALKINPSRTNTHQSLQAILKKQQGSNEK